MDSNRYTRSAVMDNRKDVIVWDRIYSQILALKALRMESDSYLFALRECQAKLDAATTPETEAKYTKKLLALMKDGKLSARRIKANVQGLREDFKLIKTMQATGDYHNINVEREPIQLVSSPTTSTFKRSSNQRDEELTRAYNKALKPNTPVLDHIPPGTTVVAKMLDSKDPNQEWILAQVIHYYPEKNRYQIEDAEADEDGQKTKYILSAKYVIPLTTHKPDFEFPPGHTVLALYPHTTCFYKAVVMITPSENRLKGHHMNHYMVHFEDDDDAERWVEKDMVLDMPTELKKA